MMTVEPKESKDFISLLFVGSPLLDITAHTGQKILDHYGLKSDDCIKATSEHQPLFQSLFNNPESQLSAGGSSQNTARIAKWTLGEMAKVSFAGCVGEDDFATKMSDRLRSEGIEPLYITLPGESTGVCACLLNSEGERSMCARLGAAEKFATSHLLTNDIKDRIAKADCIFVEGYFFAHSPKVMLALTDTCSKTQVLALSLSAEYICRNHGQNLLQILPRVDILLSNEAEARAVAPVLGLENKPTVEEIACTLATKARPPSLKPRIVVVTRGPNPVLLVQGAEKPQSFAVQEGVTVVDSVGCGDAMAGAFLAVYILTGDVAEAMRTGILAAVEIAQISGCNPTNKVLYPHQSDKHS